MNSVLLSCALQSAFAQTCPMPDDVLGHSMDDAKRAMSKAIGTNWSSNDIGCTGEERVLRIGSEPGNADTQIVQLFDLRAVRKEIASLRVCAGNSDTAA
ncbi:hypothetical protein [Burkholderia pseudomultivorans]|uniref:Uncharacterized protein n=1 Tax=Burkholderia pseudomultivorans TaxID=1207504 RepID=A0A132EA21_9BURK|nr:hypothetical protein [Burkholderia pseudomultivorans]KWF22484.1 hypothetical protein WT56_27010 [Burkholderia pseudomultivorans]